MRLEQPVEVASGANGSRIAASAGSRRFSVVGSCQPPNSGLPGVYVSGDYLGKHTPQLGGYYVVYDDGYSSFSPAKAFEEGYTRL